jgi:hypothetical protein
MTVTTGGLLAAPAGGAAVAGRINTKESITKRQHTVKTRSRQRARSEPGFPNPAGIVGIGVTQPGARKTGSGKQEERMGVIALISSMRGVNIR